MVHLPAQRERRDAPQETDSRREALDLSSIRSLEKGTTGITPTEMEKADRAIQSARETVKGENGKSPEWRDRFNQVFDILTRKMGITPPLATDIANAILFVPAADDADPEQAPETDEAEAAEADEADDESSAESAAPGPVAEKLHQRFVVTNPALRRLAGEARANDEGDEIAFASTRELESALESQKATLRKMEAVASGLPGEPAAPTSGEDESPARP
jgi:hypothetical protein